MITLDFETRSACDLKKAGSYIYSCHASTSILCLAWAFDDEEYVHLWHPGGGDSLAPLFDRISLGEIVEAHNAMFERVIWTNVGTLLGWPGVHPRQWRCSAAKAASFALPRNLEGGVDALGLPFPKDMSGNRLMLKLSKPRKPLIKELRAVGLTRGQHELYWERHGYLWHEKPEEMEALYAYCRQDVRAERALSRALRDLPEKEQEVWYLDQEINWRGVHVDRTGAEKALELATEAVHRANEEMKDITFGEVQRCTLREPFKRWIAKEGFLIPDTKGETIDAWVKKDLPSHVKRALSLWKSTNRTSTKKYVSMLARMAHDSRVRDILRYHAATTGRWGGLGIQPQNFPRGFTKKDPKKPEVPSMEEAWCDILSMTLEQLVEKYDDDVMELIANALRGAICAAPGKELLVADYASIEARGLFWTAGATRALDVLHSGKNIYKDMTGAIMEFMGKPLADPQDVVKGTHEYQLGKQSILGLGYQMGGPKFVVTCGGYGIEVSPEFGQDVVKLYRSTYPEVPRLWYAMEAAAILAVKRGPRAADPVRCSNTRWAMRGKFLHCKLPSGRLLSYYDPQVVQGLTPWGDECEKLVFMGVDTYTKKWSLQKTYGGKLVENVIQAMSRDLMAEAMLRTRGTKYQALTMTVHDELVAETDEGEGDVAEFEALMCELPTWAMGFPIAAEGWSGQRYRK